MNPTIKGKVYQVTVVDPDASTEGNVTQVEIVGGGQVKSMFEPQESLLGLIVQYVGETTSDYTNGYFYQVIESEDVPGTYVWANKTVQSGGGAGAVTSVNGQTGDVVLGAEDVGATTKNVITLTGESGTLTSAQITQVLDDTAMLEIVCDGEVFRLSNKDSTLTYRTFINTDCAVNEDITLKAIYIQLDEEAVNYGAWSLEEVSTGGSELPDPTGHAGEFLKTDGSQASWGKALENKSTAERSLVIGDNATVGTGTDNVAIGSNITSANNSSNVSIGVSSQAQNGSVAVGYNAKATGVQVVACGRNSQVTSNYGIAVGDSANVYGNSAGFGNNVSVPAADCLAIGNYAYAKNSSLSIGTARSTSTRAEADYNSIAIGHGAVAVNNDVAIGHRTRAYPYGIVIAAQGSGYKNGSHGILLVAGSNNSIVATGHTSPVGSIVLDAIDAKNTTTPYTNCSQDCFYIGLVSTLYKVLDGTTGLIPAERLGTGYDATKTQVLKNVQGVLTWVDES